MAEDPPLSLTYSYVRNKDKVIEWKIRTASKRLEIL